MKCKNCGTELTQDMLLSGMCFSCGTLTNESVEEYENRLSEEKKRQKIQHDILQKEEALKLAEIEKAIAQDKQNRTEKHLVTTGFEFHGYEIKQYKSLVSGEVVIGTGFFSNIDAKLSDAFGVESNAYVEKIKTAKDLAVKRMIADSVEIGGNAIIGISFQYASYSRDMIGVSVNGTSVFVEEIE